MHLVRTYLVQSGFGLNNMYPNISLNEVANIMFGIAIVIKQVEFRKLIAVGHFEEHQSSSYKALYISASYEFLI